MNEADEVKHLIYRLCTVFNWVQAKKGLADYHNLIMVFLRRIVIYSESELHKVEKDPNLIRI